jgi:predicted  nucleic acid-binding Zn-ribbon protein
LDFKHKETAELNKDIKVLINENQKLNEIHNDLLNQVSVLTDELQRVKDEGRNQDNTLRTRESQVDDVMTM